MAIRVAIIMLPFLVISWMIIHFGRNPVRGGRPPSDNIMISVDKVIRGILFHAWDNISVVVEEFMINSINVVRVIRI